MRPNWRSSGVATAEAMVSGLAPGRLACTDDRRKFDLAAEAQRASRRKAKPAGQRQCRGQQRRGNGAFDEWLREIHGYEKWS